MLNNIGLPGLLLIAVVTLVLFGRGKVSSLMGEMGKGISAFKHGLREGETSEESESRQLPIPTASRQNQNTEATGSGSSLG